MDMVWSTRLYGFQSSRGWLKIHGSNPVHTYSTRPSKYLPRISDIPHSNTIILVNNQYVSYSFPVAFNGLFWFPLVIYIYIYIKTYVHTCWNTYLNIHCIAEPPKLFAAKPNWWGVPASFYNLTMMFSTNRGKPQYNYPFNQIKAVAERCSSIYLYIYIWFSLSLYIYDHMDIYIYHLQLYI